MSFIGLYCGQRKPTKEELKDWEKEVCSKCSKECDKTELDMECCMGASGYLEECYD